MNGEDNGNLLMILVWAREDDLSGSSGLKA